MSVNSYLRLSLLLAAAATAVCSTATVTLDPTNFDKTLADGVWMVEFFAPWCGHCKQLQPEWEKAAKALKGIVGVAAVDADAHQSLGSRYGVKGFPTIKFMHSQSGKIKALDYSGGRTAGPIVDFALAEAKKVAKARLGGGGGGKERSSSGGGSGGAAGFYPSTSEVFNLGDDDFSQVTSSDGIWLVEFFAPWCGHCKNLKPEWIEAAASLKGKVKLGAVDCTQHEGLCSKYGVKGYPTIKTFTKGKPKDYQGGRDAAAISQYANSLWSKNAPAPPVTQLISPEQLAEHCTGGDGAAPKQLCVVAFLPHILDTGASGRNGYLKVLQSTANAMKEHPFSYLWAEGGAQSALEANFGVGGYGYPALIAVSPSKQSFASHTTSFDAKHVKDFLGRIRSGAQGLKRMDGSFGEVQPGDAWDGKDGVMIEEDEFDLSDIMGDEEPKHEEL